MESSSSCWQLRKRVSVLWGSDWRDGIIDNQLLGDARHRPRFHVLYDDGANRWHDPKDWECRPSTVELRGGSDECKEAWRNRCFSDLGLPRDNLPVPVVPVLDDQHHYDGDEDNDEDNAAKEAETHEDGDTEDGKAGGSSLGNMLSAEVANEVDMDVIIAFNGFDEIFEAEGWTSASTPELSTAVEAAELSSGCSKCRHALTGCITCRGETTEGEGGDGERSSFDAPPKLHTSLCRLGGCTHAAFHLGPCSTSASLPSVRKRGRAHDAAYDWHPAVGKARKGNVLDESTPEARRTPQPSAPPPKPQARGAQPLAPAKPTDRTTPAKGPRKALRVGQVVREARNAEREAARAERAVQATVREGVAVQRAVERLVRRVEVQAREEAQHEAREVREASRRGELSRLAEGRLSEAAEEETRQKAFHRDAAVRTVVDQMLRTVEQQNTLCAHVLPYVPGELWGGPAPVLAEMEVVGIDDDDDEGWEVAAAAPWAAAMDSYAPGLSVAAEEHESPSGANGRTSRVRWSSDDDHQLLDLVASELGSEGTRVHKGAWQRIAAQLAGGRTAEQVAHRYYYVARRQRQRVESEPSPSGAAAAASDGTATPPTSALIVHATLVTSYLGVSPATGPDVSPSASTAVVLASPVTHTAKGGRRSGNGAARWSSAMDREGGARAD